RDDLVTGVQTCALPIFAIVVQQSLERRSPLMRPNTAALFLSTVLTVAPVCLTAQGSRFADIAWRSNGATVKKMMAAQGTPRHRRSEEHTSELQSPDHLV